MKRRVSSMELVTREDNGILVERNKQPLGVQLLNPYSVGKRDRTDIIALAEEISKADSLVQATTCSKLQIIADQIRLLQEQARHVLSEAKESLDLHHAACNFHKIPGNTYHLYERESGQKYFSMLSLEEWSCHGGPPHRYLGAYFLNNDMSWISKEGSVHSLPNINDITKNILPLMYEEHQKASNVEKMDC